jgi:hypothetical protein
MFAWGLATILAVALCVVQHTTAETTLLVDDVIQLTNASPC